MTYAISVAQLIPTTHCSMIPHVVMEEMWIVVGTSIIRKTTKCTCVRKMAMFALYVVYLSSSYLKSNIQSYNIANYRKWMISYWCIITQQLIVTLAILLLVQIPKKHTFPCDDFSTKINSLHLLHILWCFYCVIPFVAYVFLYNYGLFNKIFFPYMG